MRWKLIRRRLSISSPRMAVRSQMAWPLRWAFAALVFGFSAAIALWAFEMGKEIAGLDQGSRAELIRLRNELTTLREERDKAQAVANTSESLLKAERAAQTRLAEQLRLAESDKLSLQEDLGFFERLLPANGATAAAGAEPLQVRGLQVEPESPGRWRYQLLIMQPGRQAQPFAGRYELIFTGTDGGKPWTLHLPGGPQPLQVRQYARVDGRVDAPPQAVVKSVQLRVTDAAGAVRASQTVQL